LSGNPGFARNTGSPIKAFGDDEKLPEDKRIERDFRYEN
jgi:hypothetical protein